ncbi:hypothetical protein G6F70_005217 [Rhizopus microsporus]|uniref:Xylanolytic transcriptional activator regulatory domain-containing protein n=2 Tax=Rhizopus TaxID=4842 RepID=A0A1X0SGH7_RHIZD|nr:hypothetical protein G6F71_006527 [Rhizopus microsporus]KAG1199107.1 hypothetical protein G6F70_005217 [Rhizopus microsporus]KAG1209267.1 hypothetical protein G6F69_006502 [Rhizopus microsporus]KAG1230677.1 hypothetical protein G6F67_006294 [Rhizopus microsporus]KAG1262979.1 hypothetical protein G6F68_005516 [Rhizopus microsporus]
MEGYKTCKNCILAEEGCTYNIPIKKRGPPSGYAESLENKLQRIESILTKASSSRKRDQSLERKDISAETLNDVIIRRMMASNVSKQQQLRSIDKDLFISLVHAIIPPVGLCLQKNKCVLQVQKEESANFDEQIDAIDDAIDSTFIHSRDDVRTIDQWVQKMVGIDKDLCDRLLRVYFAHIHPSTPVVNKAVFLQEYRGIRPNFPSALLLIAICLTTVRYIRLRTAFGDAEDLNDSKPWNLSDKTSNSLFDRLSKYVFKRSCWNLTAVQAAILILVVPFKQQRWEKHWLINSRGLQGCLLLKLNRSSEALDISHDEKETRRRCWWSAYILDRLYSAESGKPLGVLDEDCDELYPSEFASYDEVMDVMTETDQHLPRFPSLDEKTAQQYKGDIPLYRPFVHMIKLSKILGITLQNLYTPKAQTYCAEHGSDAIVAFLDNELSNWRASFPPLSETSGQTSIFPTSGIISLVYYTNLILLHRPFIKVNKDSNKNTKLSAQTSLAICTSAATKIVEISKKMRHKDYILVSCGYAFYPIVTATLIHIFNACNPEKTISDPAKINLLESLDIIDKLNHTMSSENAIEMMIRKSVLRSKLCTHDSTFAKMLHGQEQQPKEVQEDKANSDFGWLDNFYDASQQANQNNIPIPSNDNSNLALLQQQQQQQIANMNDMYSIRQFNFNPVSQNVIEQSNILQWYPLLPSYNFNTPVPPLHTVPSQAASYDTLHNHLMLTGMDNNSEQANTFTMPLISHDSMNLFENSSFWGTPDSTSFCSSLYDYLFQ